jgi:hypothetical protein
LPLLLEKLELLPPPEEPELRLPPLKLELDPRLPPLLELWLEEPPEE